MKRVKGMKKKQVYDTPRRCRHRSKKIPWCRKLEKFCDPPREYETCAAYEPRPVSER